jgi:16S rRNA (uracil1498-N3)-methyltransferase
VRRRFFVDAFEADRAVLTGEAAHHLGRVLRAEPGQVYELSDGTSVRLGKIEFSGRDRVEFSLHEAVPVRAGSLRKALLLAIVKFDAFEWAIEKATELGVDHIVPLAAARTDTGLLTAAAKRAARWKKILFESSQQSRRVRLPVLADLKHASAAFQEEKSERKVILSEKAEAPPLRRVFEPGPAKAVALAIGPEGGWTDAEFDLARSAGFAEASLGRLVLRTETAVAAALAAVNYACEA